MLQAPTLLRLATRLRKTLDAELITIAGGVLGYLAQVCKLAGVRCWPTTPIAELAQGVKGAVSLRVSRPILSNCLLS